MEEQKKIIKDIISIRRTENLPEKEREANFKPFCGIPRRSPVDTTKIIILTEAFSSENEFFEFSLKDIGHIEEIETISDPDGRNAVKVRLWVKKGARALSSRSFTVE
ncbi:MAG: hypothetical protein KAZ87_05390 [Spirochaetes bacterium]|nr:hypothetical protein [Spirochaetota bacterium]